MRIEIIEEPLIDEIEIQIKCKEKNEYVKQLAATIFEEQLIINGKIENESIYDLVKSVFIIALVYGITILGIYSSTQNDAEDINKKLLGK